MVFLDTRIMITTLVSSKLFLFQLSQPTIVGIVYISPEYTKYSSDEVFNEIEQEYLRYHF